MADDILNEGEGSEEENQMSNDDFGLPDLEFDELQELDLNSDELPSDVDDDSPDLLGGDSDFDMSLLDGIDDEDEYNPETEMKSGIDEVEDVLDSAQLISDRLGNEDVEESGSLDLSERDSKVSYDDLLSVDSSSSESSDYDSQESIFSSDSSFSYGDESPKIEFQKPEEAELPSSYKPYAKEEKKGNWGKYIAFGIIGSILIGFSLKYFSGTFDEENKKPVAEKVIKKKEKKSKKSKQQIAAARKAKEEKKKAEEEARILAAQEEAAQAALGEIQKLTERTGRSYVVIGSFVDEDLAMDYSNELVADGRGVKIIPPFGKSKLYRVSIADYGTYSDAAANIGDYKSEFGEDIWALKY